jgi:hypothetical protein
MIALHSVSISNGNITIKIHRARLVNHAYLDDREDHLEYDDNDNFHESVDVYRRYTTLTDAVKYVWLPMATCDKSTFASATQDAYPVIENSRLSIVHFHPAVYSGDTVVPTYSFSGTTFPSQISVSYLSGRDSNPSTEIDTCRLAHTFMPHPPDTYEPYKLTWIDDHTVPEQATITPYGNSNGALKVWISDARERVGFGVKIPKLR